MPVWADWRAASRISATRMLVFEGGHIVALFNLAGEDGFHVVEGVVVWGLEGVAVGDCAGGVVLAADLNFGGVDGLGVAGLAVKVHLFLGEGPVPGAFDDGDGVAVVEDDVGFVGDVRVEVRLEALGDGGDGRWGLRRP